MKKTLLFIALCFFCQFGQSQTEKAWAKASGQNVLASKNTERLSFPKEYSLYHFSPETMRQVLATAPARLGKQKKGVIISLPNTAGAIENYEVFEASNFDAELQAQFPEIRSYVGRGITDKRAVLRMSVDPRGIQTMVFRTDKRNEFLEPYSEDGTIYAVFNSSRAKGNLPFTCTTEDVRIAESLPLQTRETNRTSLAELMVFRLAMSCNGEYTSYFGGTVAGALAAINASITRVNGVFEMDFAIHMDIVASSTSVIYTNAGTDPYTTMGAWNGQLQTALTANIGEANYDVGHMFGATGGGGNAGCIGCVCVNNQKGRGITSPADGIPMGDNFDIDYVAHELGHQFGGNHTFSNNVEGSGVNVEPGSGSTIMGYAGITAQDIAAHSDDYFVYGSIKQVQDNMVGKTCPVRTPISGAAPVIGAGFDYTIPKSTPFVLTGSGTDESATLNFCWEQNDNATTQTGANSQASATKTGGPNWRSYDPVASPSRYFPPLARVVINQLTTTFGLIRSEAVSSVARTLNFTLTGRDNFLGIGLTNTDATLITVNGTAGPFLVSAPNTNVSWAAGTNQLVTWDVAGTTANNVNSAYVDIFMSADGGFTYPMMLASQVPNDGSETISVPNMVGTSNRIMVKGNNHVFYDISNTNFTIAAAPSTFSIAFNGNAGEQNKTACQGANVTYTLPYTALSGFSGTTTFSITGQPAFSIVNFTPSTIAANGTVSLTISGTGSAAPGLYSMTVTGTSGAETKTVPLYFQLFSSNFATATLTSPANLATAQSTSLTLTWVADSNATSYDVQVATDAAFTNIFTSGTVNTASYLVSGLAQATNYFWRVLPMNASCSGAYSPASTFQTGQISCSSFASANVPLTISASGTPTINSTLTIASGVTIADLNITMNVGHSWVNDLTATLISPSGTEVQLVAAPCTSVALNNIVATFDDAGTPVVCSNNPAIGGTVQPFQSLAAFNGQNSGGLWTLRIFDAYNLDGGALNSWSLNICSTLPLETAENLFTDFVIYPNPNNGSFNVQFNTQSESDITINVHDIRGREIFTRTYQNNGLFNENLQLNNVQTGMYLVTVQDGNRKEVKKIVVE